MTKEMVKGKEKIDSLLIQMDNIFDKSDVFNQITTRAVDDKNNALAKFHIFDDKKLEIIAERMPEINRATRTLGRSNTQTTNRLMTLTMLSDTSPYRVLRQCLSQIEKKRMALKDSRFKNKADRDIIEKSLIDLEFLEEEIKEAGIEIEKSEDIIETRYFRKEKHELEFRKRRIQNKIEKTASKISDSMLYVEGCLKDIASFQESYDQVRRNNNIPEKWDERDVEKSEVRSHIRTAFLHAYRDVMSHGRLGMGTLEYLQQFGIHPNTALSIVSNYIEKIHNAQKEGNKIVYNDLSVFLDACEEEFKDSYKSVIKQLGIDNIHDDWYVYQEKLEE